MSGLKGITINTDPAAEAHVYAEDDAAIYQSIFGSDGVLTIGQQCESQVISNNKVRVKDGVIVVGGHIARIPYGDYCDCEIANGQSGKNRNDIIIAKFVSTGTGGIDTMACEVKQGTATTDTATDPVLTQEDLYESGKIREMPLYRVKIEGLSIVGVEPMFDIVPTIPTLNAYLSDLSSKLEVVKFTLTASSSAIIRAQNCYYVPLTGQVHIEAAIDMEGHMTAATALATVPDSYKPLAGHILPAMFEDASGRASINTDGVLRQHTSNVQRYMYISTDYFI